MGRLKGKERGDIWKGNWYGGIIVCFKAFFYYIRERERKRESAIPPPG